MSDSRNLRPADRCSRAWRRDRRIGPAVLLCLVLALCAGCAAPGSPLLDKGVQPRPSDVVTYLDAVVYAGATHYYFADADGGEIKVVVSNDPGSLVVRGTERLLDPAPVDGPPGPDPALLGQPMTLVYDRAGRVIGIDRAAGAQRR